MQSWVIKIDIKLNIDDFNWSLDGQIIANTEQENVYLAYSKVSHQVREMGFLKRE